MITTLQKFKESITSHKKDDEIFNYRSLIEDTWRPLIKDAQKFQNITFDLENNDSTGEKKSIIIPVNLRKDQPVKNKINAELCLAGGDWEYPVLYFKIQFETEYGLISNEYNKNPKYIWDFPLKFNGKKYVIIPGEDNGNHIIKNEHGNYTAYTTKDDVKKDEVKITDKDKKLAWKWLNDLFETVVKERHKMLDIN